LLFIFLAFTSSVFAQESNIIKNAPGIEKYPDAQSVILLDDIKYIVNADGSSSQSEHEIIKILAPNGIEKYAKVLRSYIKPDQTISIEIARIIKPDGKIIKLEQGKDILQEAKLAQGSPIYNNFIIVSLDFSKAEVNDIIEFKLTLHNKKSILKDNYWSVSFIEDDVPMEETRYTVRMHKDANKLRWFSSGPNAFKGQPEKKSLSQGVEYKWVLKGRKPIMNEPNAPGVRDRTSYIMVSTTPSWEELSRGLYKVYEPCLKPDKDIQNKVNEIIKDIKEPQDKINKIASFVKGLKTINLGFNPESIMQINPGDMLKCSVLTKLDAQILFISMLRAAGFEAYPAIISDLRYGSVRKEFPSPFQFNNLVSAIKFKNNWIYMDASSPFAQPVEIQAGIEGQDLLVLKTEGSQVIKTPISSADKNLEDMVSNAQLSSDGSVGVTLKLTETGTRKMFWDAFLNLIQAPESQGIVFNRLVTVISPEAKLLGFHKEESVDKNTLSMELTFMVDEYPLISGNYWIVKMPLLPAQRMEFLEQDSSKRQFPVVLGSTSKEVKTFNITIPEGFSVKSLPKNISFSNKVGSLKVNSVFQNSKISYEYIFQVDKTDIPVTEFKDLQDLYYKSFKASSEVILLEKQDLVK
jgi:hypothetical protein